VRIFIALSFLACAGPALAQEQEGKLLDRLLRPDVGMQNIAQHKHFTVGGNQIDKQAVAAPFHFQEKSTAKTFADAREFGATNPFATRHSRAGDGTAQITKSARITRTASAASNSMIGTTAAMESGRAMATRDSASSTRGFLDQGKSQKALSQQDKPLTIEQVRDLLNKNK
jgi:hypothetical protein